MARHVACILGCAGLELGAEERAFFRDARPWGFILFKRNIDTPEQVIRLTAALRESIDTEAAPILIDQEGGRVQRMGPPHWPTYPPGRAYGEILANDPLTRREAVRLGARLMAHDLRQVSITVDCVPVADVPSPDGHEVIGDRAYAKTAAEVATLARAAAEGLLAGGVLPVIKHIPGHGRAVADSHHELPVVDAPRRALEETDFAPFRVMSDMPMAMTAHVVYAAFDKVRSATVSPVVVRQVMRRSIGFGGLIMTDDLGMKALQGGLTALAEQSLAAGCDVALHCSGKLDENRQVVAGAKSLAGAALRRARAALTRIVHTPEPLDEGEARARFAELMSGRSTAAAADPTADGRR